MPGIMRFTILTLILMLLFTGLSPFSCRLGVCVAAETPEAVFYGSVEAEALLGNLNYADVAGENLW